MTTTDYSLHALKPVGNFIHEMHEEPAHSHSYNRASFITRLPTKLPVLTPSRLFLGFGQAEICHDCHIIEKKQESDSVITGK